MAEHSMIRDYLASLARQLPGAVVEELADGLDQAYRSQLGRGLPAETAARAAVAEFGEPRVVIAAFADASAARREARRLLIAGPAIGACWGAALVTAKAWTWPVPAAGRVMFGVCLLAVIALLAFASLSRRYRTVRSAALAGLAGICLLDAAMLGAAVSMAAEIRLPMALAAVTSVLRVTYAARSLRRLGSRLAGC